jgi:cobalt/nickel transport system permease protein
MHISDGVLSAEVLLVGAAIAAGGTAVGLKKLDVDKMPRVALLSASFFIASLIHIPFGPASVHLLLGGLMGLLLGWACFPAILVGLLLQALLFGYGGLTVLGVTTVNIGVPALIVYLVFRGFINKEGKTIPLIGAALAGAFAVLLSAIFTAFSLVFSGAEFIPIAKIIVIAHLPVMAVEGMVNVSVVMLLKKAKPEMLEGLGAIRQRKRAILLPD